mmetsp:Transcript_2263/g.8067  ORF Transcript_2263/g.8067 Transcript_2263/m.8067 type:complete len:199 (+) Transcript_2263:150-746(+)
MEGITADAPAASQFGASQSSFFNKLTFTVKTRYQRFLDLSTPRVWERWVGMALLVLVYFLRVYLVGGFYIVTYALGIYLLNLLIGFLTPKVDPETVLMEIADTVEAEEEGALPVNQEDEFKPFIRRLPEFKFWLSATKAFLVALFCTFFRVLDIPVFWPILLIYFIALFCMTMRKQIQHMVKHKYIPFSFGKPKFQGK